MELVLEELHFQADEEWMAWGGSTRSPKVESPIKVPKSVWGKHAGYINFLMMEGLKAFEDTTNSQKLAANGVKSLLDYMMTRKHKSRSRA